jgi:hypothetical protein
MNVSPSVFVAEAVALALGATLLHIMHLNPLHFFIDNQLLSHYINSTGHLDIPDWRDVAYTHTHTISSSLTGASKVFNISRNHNHMANSLAKEGLELIQSNSLQLDSTCTNPSHARGCPLLRALQLVTINSVMAFTTYCC